MSPVDDRLARLEAQVARLEAELSRVTALPEVLDVEEAAQVLRVEVHTVYEALRDGRLVGSRIGKRGAIRIRRQAVLQALDRGMARRGR